MVESTLGFLTNVRLVSSLYERLGFAANRCFYFLAFFLPCVKLRMQPRWRST